MPVAATSESLSVPRFFNAPVFARQDVTHREREESGLMLRKHAHTMSLLFANDCRIRQLQFITRLLAVHRQLRRAMFGDIPRQVRAPRRRCCRRASTVCVVCRDAAAHERPVRA